ncbi:hypothetical protein [Aeromicrobium alkaliterrae]|uniref:DUF4145 domain-containing protein n=1 Tax=Aeromicrobium alkaliterrae TaxID=302168 RepID=A0ABN2JST4_9ACTN
MTWREFISDLVGSVAWPLAILILVLLSRKYIAAAFAAAGPPKRLKVGTSGVEVEFEQRVREARTRLELSEPDAKIPAVIDGGDASGGRYAGITFLSTMETLALAYPSAAVLMSFIRLEQVFRDCLSDRIPVTGRPLTMRSMISFAESQNLLSQTELALLKDHVALRNAIAHGQRLEVDMTPSAAMEYAEFAYETAVSLRFALGQRDFEEPI